MAPGYHNGLVDLSTRGPRRDQHTGNTVGLRYDTTGDNATMTGARGSNEDYHTPDNASKKGYLTPFHQTHFTMHKNQSRDEAKRQKISQSETCRILSNDTTEDTTDDD
eukprot:16444966-Heterocapsa_arctica.AAC.1